MGTVIGAVSHILLVVPAIPSVIASGNALPPFIISLLILAFGEWDGALRPRRWKLTLAALSLGIHQALPR